MRIRVRNPLRAIVAIALTAAVVVGSVAARADTPEELDAAKARLDELRAKISREESAVDALQREMDVLAGRIEEADSEIERTLEQIASTEERVEATERRLERLRARLSERAVDAYMSGASNLDLLLGSASMTVLSDRIEYMSAVSEADAELANSVENTAYELEVTQAELETQLRAKQKSLASLQADRAELEAKFAEQEARLASTISLRADAADLVSKLDERFQAELALPPPGSSASGSSDGVPGPLYACPVSGPHAYADTFGQLHVHPGWSHIHQGNDIMAPYGAPIVSPIDGVAVSGTDENAGLYVTVTGSGGFVQMLHMSAFGNLGAVKTGEVVGYIGTSGNASGPHTHFEWHPGGGPAVDPYPHLNEVC
jgi:murein DD-endopeptidase MepM/ murein hydrolase activator NlpD